MPQRAVLPKDYSGGCCDRVAFRPEDPAGGRDCPTVWPCRWRLGQRTIADQAWRASQRHHDSPAPEEPCSAAPCGRSFARDCDRRLSWRKGSAYGTIIVDLERRKVVDVLKARSVEATANWLKQRPEIEFVSRDRCGLYAQGVRRGAPHAQQVADRFHLLQNFRENIEREMTSVSRSPGRSRLPAVVGDRHETVRRQRRHSREALFVNAKRMHAAGRTFGDIATEIGVGRRTIAKWMKVDDLPDRQRSMLKPSSPLYFQEYLARRWAEGDRVGRRLLHDVRRRGYLGSLSHLERLLSTWRRRDNASAGAPTQPSPPRGSSRFVRLVPLIRRQDGRSRQRWPHPFA